MEYRTDASWLIFAFAPTTHGEGWIVEFHTGSLRRNSEVLGLGALQEWATPGITPGELTAEVGRAHFGVSDEAWTLKALERLGGLLGGRFSALLTDDVATLDAVARAYRMKGIAMAQAEVSRRADEAFRRKDWRAVVRRLEPYEAGLKRSDQLKLAYARKRL